MTRFASAGSPWRWTTDDTEIFRLAIPALGSLAAGPLYVLVDTAIVGHLGQAPLAGLSLAAVVLDGVLALTNFLAYATTAQVGRAHAAGLAESTRGLARQALWLAMSLGAAFVLLAWAAGRPLLDALGGGGVVPALGDSYLRIAAFGLPFALVANAGQGYLRGVRDMRAPLLFIAGGNALNVVLELLFVYGFGWGLEGSAAATVLAQGAMGTGFIYKLVQAAGSAGAPELAGMRPLLRMSGEIFGRTGALYSSFIVMSAALAHMGAASLAAHQVLFQLWLFIALALDAIAIAGQVLVSRALGAGLIQHAVAGARRMIAWSALAGLGFAVLLLALSEALPRIFTADAPVLERVGAAWLLFALMQPLNGAVFALDGILIGAGDTRYLMWSMLGSTAACIPVTYLAYVQSWGIAGVWLALTVLIAVRLATTGGRFATGRWTAAGLARATGT
jgi:putative MATE family efflux protein